MNVKAASPTWTSTLAGAGYVIRLENFEGPLELLLYLIERQELDITAVSIARVTDQYLEYLAQAQDVSPALLAEFVAMAARLLLIKSRALLPKPPVEETEEEEDPGEVLARQLRLYKQFRDIARTLGEREAAHLRAYVREAPLPDLEQALEPGAVTLEDLLRALREVLERQADVVPDVTVVTPYPVTLQDKLAELRSLLPRVGRLQFQDILRQSRHRQEIIVSFLAVLEMLRLGEVHVEQADLFGPITVVWRGTEAPSASPTAPSEGAPT